VEDPGLGEHEQNAGTCGPLEQLIQPLDDVHQLGVVVFEPLTHGDSPESVENRQVEATAHVERLAAELVEMCSEMSHLVQNKIFHACNMSMLKGTVSRYFKVPFFNINGKQVA
jgi:hypothetical protein